MSSSPSSRSSPASNPLPSSSSATEDSPSSAASSVPSSTLQSPSIQSSSSASSAAPSSASPSPPPTSSPPQSSSSNSPTSASPSQQSPSTATSPDSPPASNPTSPPSSAASVPSRESASQGVVTGTSTVTITANVSSLSPVVTSSGTPGNSTDGGGDGASSSSSTSPLLYVLFAVLGVSIVLTLLWAARTLARNDEDDDAGPWKKGLRRMKRLAKYKSESEASHGDGEADGSPDGAATSVEGVLSTSGPASDATVSSGEAAALKRRSNLSASTVSLALPSSTNGAESVGEQKLEPSGMVLTQRDGTSPDRIESLERRVLAGARFPSQPLGVEARERQRRPGLSGVPFSNETNSNSSSPDEEAPSKPAQVSSSPYGSLRGGSAHSDSVHSASSRQSPQPSPFLMASSGSTRGMTAYLVQSSGSMYESLPRTGSDATLNRRDGIITAQYQSTPPSPMHQSGPVILPDPQQQYTTGYIAIPTYSFGYYAVPVAVAAGHSPQSSPISPVPPMSLSNQTVPTQPSSAEQEMPSTDESVQPISRKITSTSTSTSYRTPHWPARSVVSSPGSSVFYSLPPSGRNTMQRQDAEVAGEALPAEQDHTAESGVIGDGAASSPRSSDSDQSGSSGEGDSDSDNEEQFSDASATDNSFESTSTFAGPGPLYRRPSFSGSSPLKFSAPMSDLKEEDEDVEIVLEATSFTTKTIGDTQTTVASPPLAGALLPIIQKRKKKAVSNENASVAPTAADAGGDVTIVITDEGPDSLANRKEKRNVLGAIQSKLLSWRNRGGANTRSNPPPQPRTTIVSESLTPAKAAATVTFSPNLVVSPPSPPHRPGGPVATASTAAVESPPVVLVPALKQSRSGSGAGNEGGAEGGRRRTRQVISQVSEQGSEVTLIGVGKAAGGPGEKRSSGVARVSWAVMD